MSWPNLVLFAFHSVRGSEKDLGTFSRFRAYHSFLRYDCRYLADQDWNHDVLGCSTGASKNRLTLFAFLQLPPFVERSYEAKAPKNRSSVKLLYRRRECCKRNPCYMLFCFILIFVFFSVIWRQDNNPITARPLRCLSIEETWLLKSLAFETLWVSSLPPERSEKS